MARHIASVVAALLFVAAPAGAGPRDAGACERNQAAQQRAGQPPAGHKDDKQDEQSHRPKWWIEAKERAELGITDQQSAAVELVWQKSLPALRDARERLDKAEDALSQLTQRENSDEAAVIAQIERVENTRAELNKGRTLMIYRMNKILTPDQRAKVKAMYERRDPPKRGLSPR